MWEDRWDMEFNSYESQMVRVPIAGKVINIVYTLHGQVLKVVNNAILKYLEVDNSIGLSWNSHIDSITANVNLNLLQMVGDWLSMSVVLYLEEEEIQ